MSNVTSLSQQHKIRCKNIDEGLDRLVRTTPIGVTMSHRQIAAECGCSMQAIWNIEKSALDKLRRKLPGTFSDYTLED